ncbi:MAG: hypothetical protein IT230_09250 [Flavobacteriales bacterium]|nr:hypothetical protein [Flavobacteriales bacterium]
MALRSSYKFAALLALGSAMAACGGGNNSEPVAEGADSLRTAVDPDGVVKLGNKLFSIPSPVQTIMLASDLNTPYAKELTLPTEGTARFVTKEQQAMALGMYGADLAYTASYQDAQQALKVLKVIEGLSGQLNMTNALGKNLLGGFKQHLNNRDSLLRYTGQAFRAADTYLKSDQQEDVSTWVLAGGWIESLYLTLGATGEQVDPRVAARLAEQRHTLDNLVLLLEKTGGAPQLLASLKELTVPYREVVSTYTFVEPTVDADRKTTYINSKTSAQITPAAAQTIIEKVRAIRSAIIA